MAQKIRFRLDGTIYNGIANAEDFGVTITEDTSLNFRFASFDNELQFVTDAYDYLNTLISDACGCGLVDVTVEYLCASQSWTRLCTGYLILSECVTALDKCKITTKVFDNTFSTLINNNKSIPFSVRSSITKNLIPISTLPTWYAVDFFVPATGAYDTTNFVYCIRVEEALKHLVKCMTDDRVDCVAPPFASGQFQNLMITNGAAILAPQVFVETSISYQDLYLALTSKMRLGMKATLQDNGRPLLTIDYATNIDAQAANIDMALVSGVVKKVDTSMLYASVKFGNNKYYEQWECNGGDTACTFTQTPFRGYREETFGLLGDCNTSTQLDLSTKEVVFDTNIIEDIFVWGNRGYDNTAVIVSCENSPIPIIKRAKRGDPYDIGQTVYNAEFTNEQVAARWIDGIPNSPVWYNNLYDFGTTGFNYRHTITGSSWDIIFPDFSSYVGVTGNFLNFNDAFLPNTDFIDERTYRVPQPGIYNFFAQIVVSSGLITNPPLRVARAMIRRYSSSEDLILIERGELQQGNLNLVVSVTAVLVCDAGDLIRADVEGAITDGSATILTQYILPNLGDNETYFTGIGFPIITGNELQPYNPCDFKRNLYDFKKPLTMGQIQDLMDNPSAPVRFSRTENINAGATGVTSKVTIDSIVKQMATFTIRSNKNL
jgi:hypothetical protein